MPHCPNNAPTFLCYVRVLTIRLVFFSLLWWVLTEGAFPMSLLGIIGVGTAVAVSMRLLPAGTWAWRVGPLFRFVPFFLWQSLLGGLDVAYRALHPRIALHPEVIRHHFQLRQEHSRVFFLWVVSLLPGTAGVDLHGDVASVHVLDMDLAGPEKLHDLEQRIAKLISGEYS